MDAVSIAAINRAQNALSTIAPPSRLDLSKSDASKYSLFRALRSLRDPYSEPAEFERECSDTIRDKISKTSAIDNVSGGSILVPADLLTKPLGDAAIRAMASTPGAAGGYMVGVENMGFIDILRNRSVAIRLGATVLSGLQGDAAFPRKTATQSVTWQAGEHTSATPADQTFGQLSMTPKTAIAITDVSEQLLRQTAGAAESLIMADLAATVALGVDSAVIHGSGGAQPIGIYNTEGVDTNQDAGTASYAKVLAFIESAGASNAIGASPGWATNIAGASILAQRQRFTSTDSPLWDGNLVDGQLVGFRAMSSQQLASGELIFGSWDDVVIGEWGVLELATDRGGTRFDSATVGIRAMWMVDVMIRYPQAFVVSTNLS